MSGGRTCVESPSTSTEIGSDSAGRLDVAQVFWPALRRHEATGHAYQGAYAEDRLAAHFHEEPAFTDTRLELAGHREVQDPAPLGEGALVLRRNPAHQMRTVRDYAAFLHAPGSCLGRLIPPARDALASSAPCSRRAEMTSSQYPLQQRQIRRGRTLSTTLENEAIATVENEATQTDWMGDLCGGLGSDPAACGGRCFAASGRAGPGRR